MKSKLIVVEGTDCSGKETQTKLLVQRLLKDKLEIFDYYYPHYSDPTGKIVGGPYLGKEYICEGYFEEGAAAVDPKIAALYYAADFKYSSPIINQNLEQGTSVVLDRYVFSSFAHQAGKEKDGNKRLETYNWMDNLFFNFLELKKPDLTILLYMPYEYSVKLNQGRISEAPDQLENNIENQKAATIAYLELSEKYNFNVISCVNDGKLKTVEEIHEEVYEIVKSKFI